MAIVNFYNTYGYYYSSSNSRVEAESHYYASRNRKWLMYMYPAQTSLIKGKVKKATVRMYNQQNYNSTFSFYAVASKSAAVGTAFTEGNYFGKTATQSCVLHPQWSEYNFDVTTCFQYAQENWPGEQWYLWFYWTAGTSDGTALIGYNNTSYADWRCPYFTIETEDFGSFLPDENGKPTQFNPYVWKTSNPTIYYYPETAMTSDSSAGCTTTASSVYSTSYPAWQTFNKNYAGNCWASTAADTERWIQITIPKSLYNIKVRIVNPTGTNGPISGIIYGSNNGGSSLTQIGSFSGRSAAAGGSSLVTCNNSNTAYNTIRVKCTEAGAINLNNVAIGELLIIGTDVGTSNGNWAKAEPLIWKTENPITYTYPAAGMSNWLSQNCFVCASSESNTNFPAFHAFDRNAANNWASHTLTYDPQPWIQITIPKPLYNISVKINNDSDTAKGPVAGVIYGSNDNGTTLTQIGSFSGRSAAASASTTHQCNNATVAYKTIRIQITALSSNVTNVDIGEIYISGTDIGTNGGWVGNINLNSVIRLPKAAMNSNISQDCLAYSSTIYDTNHNPFNAFNSSLSTSVKPWASVSSDTAPWIQITLPIPLYNIAITIHNRYDYNNATGIASATIYGSNDDGNNFVKLATISGRDKAYRIGTTTLLKNNATSYSTIKIAIEGSGTFCVGEIMIFGTQKP